MMTIPWINAMQAALNALEKGKKIESFTKVVQGQRKPLQISYKD